MRVSQEIKSTWEPVQGLVERVASAMGSKLPDAVVVGDIEGLWGRDDGTLTVSDCLLGPGLQHPYDAAVGVYGLDRWRRLAACVLEASWTSQSSEAPRWMEVGVCLLAVHEAAPELRLLPCEVAHALGSGSVGANPRLGMVVLQAWRETGAGLEEELAAFRQAGKVPIRRFLDAARHLMDPRSPLAGVAAGARRMTAQDVPLTLPPWTWARLKIPAHARGGKVGVRGVGGVVPAWAPAGVSFSGIAASGARDASLQPESGGPSGTWELKSAQGFAQIFGARGVSFTFHASGRLEVVLADAFVGSVADLETAERVGTSGTATGRWRVEGPATLSLHKIVPQGLTIHGRDDSPFLAPAGDVGLAAWLPAMEGARWRWRLQDQRLHLSGAMWSSQIELRFARVQASN